MTGGWCSRCLTTGPVSRYRLWLVGLRYFHRDCADIYSRMGMVLTEVTDADPRAVSEPVARERRHTLHFGLGRRVA